MDWKEILRLKDEPIFGLDIGSSSIKAVQLQKQNGGFVVTAAAITEIEKTLSDDGEHTTDENIIKAINTCVSSAELTSKFAVCALCGPEVAVRSFKFPALPLEEIQGAVMLEASQVCPFNLSDAEIDYQVTPDSENNITGFMVAATHKLIKRKSRLVKSASLNCALLDVDGLALLNCLIGCHQDQPAKTNAILNIGGSYTTLAITSDNHLPFIRDIAYAGEGIIAQIAGECGLSPQNVWQILFSGENQPEAPAQFYPVFEKATRKLVTDLAETLRYITVQQKITLPEQVFFCGSFALAKGMTDMLGRMLPSRVVLWNPFSNLRSKDGQINDFLQKTGPAFAVAAGLAMRVV